MIFSFVAAAVDGDVPMVGELEDFDGVEPVEGVDGGEVVAVVRLGPAVVDDAEPAGVLVVDYEQPATVSSQATAMTRSTRTERFCTLGD